MTGARNPRAGGGRNLCGENVALRPAKQSSADAEWRLKRAPSTVDRAAFKRPIVACEHGKEIHRRSRSASGGHRPRRHWNRTDSNLDARLADFRVGVLSVGEKPVRQMVEPAKARRGANRRWTGDRAARRRRSSTRRSWSRKRRWERKPGGPCAAKWAAARRGLRGRRSRGKDEGRGADVALEARGMGGIARRQADARRRRSAASARCRHASKTSSPYGALTCDARSKASDGLFRPLSRPMRAQQATRGRSARTGGDQATTADHA